MDNDSDISELLLQAINARDLHIVDELLRRGADSNHVYIGGFTPLYRAIEANDLQIVRRLLAAGATPDAKVRPQVSLLHFAARNSEEILAELLVHSSSDPTVLKDSFGRTLLHEAAWGRAGAAVELLLNKGLSPSVVDQTGYAPLHLAAIAGNAMAVSILIKHNCPIDAQDNRRGDTALHLAAEMKCEAVVSALLNAGADKTLKNYRGETALDIATQQHNNLPAITLLKDDFRAGNNESSSWAKLRSNEPRDWVR